MFTLKSKESHEAKQIVAQMNVLLLELEKLL